MTRVFISYRRNDASANAGRLCDWLQRQFKTQNVFLDTESIAPGDRFPAVLRERLATTEVLLAVVGKGWTTITDAAGNRRILDPQDFVALEVRSALERGIRVIPVLVGGASMPKADQLPPELRSFVECNAVTVDDARFRQDFATVAASAAGASIHAGAAASAAAPRGADSGSPGPIWLLLRGERPVDRSTLQGGRGALHESEADAYRRCAAVRMGYCCANGRVIESTAQQCRGVFSFDQGWVRESCTPPPQGYCCAEGRVTASTRNKCGGSFFNDEATAKKTCAAPPPPGYCCAAGEITRANRTQCRGSFYMDEATARKACVAPEQGYCCAGGKVPPSTRDRCGGGVFSRSQAEAQRACRPVALEAKPDATLKKEVAKQPPPPADGPVVK